MNSDLESIYIWSKQWLVNFNPQKIKAMVFSNINLPNDVEITFQDKLVKLVASHKHLGITFDSNGKQTWSRKGKVCEKEKGGEREGSGVDCFE
jgi:hypothetical protein